MMKKYLRMPSIRRESNFLMVIHYNNRKEHGYGHRTEN
jgi:hypothetical protein